MDKRRFGVFAIVLGECLALAGCTAGKPAPPGTEYCDPISDFATPEDCVDFTRQAALQHPGKAAFNAPNPMRRGDTVAVWLAVADQPEPPKPSPTPTPQPPADTAATPEPTPTPTPAPSPAAATPAPAAPTPSPSPSEEPKQAPDPADLVDPMPGRTVRFDTIVGPRMAAELTGSDGFTIVPANGDTRHKILRMGPPYAAALWKWNVTADRGGTHTLAVKTVVEAIDRKGEFHPMTPTEATFSFTVQVTPWQNFWDGVVDAPKKIDSVTAVVVALTSLVGALWALWAAIRRRKKREAADSDEP